jgi:cobalt-zinc-cadmium efflux system outer membrane protein
VLSWRRAGACLTVCATALIALPPAHAAPAARDSVPVVQGPLTLSRTLSLARRHLILQAGDLRVRAADTRVRGAGKAANPELAATIENFGGGLPDDVRETTLEIGQPLALGGDRGARSALARGEHRLAVSEATLLRRDHLALSAERFIRAWTLQARVARLIEGERLANETVRAADERYRAGAVLMLERTRAESRAVSQAADREAAQAELAIARRELASSWGATVAEFDSLVADSILATPPAPLPQADRQPEVERARALEASAQARLKLAEAERVPDLTVLGGVRRLGSASGFVAGLQLPLPLWNRGGANLSALRDEVDAAAADQRAAAQSATVELAGALDRQRAAAATYETLRQRVLPMREQLIDDLLRAYRAGRLNFLDLIAEQAVLLDTQLALVDARADLWRATTRVAILSGRGLTPEDDR